MISVQLYLIQVANNFFLFYFGGVQFETNGKYFK